MPSVKLGYPGFSSRNLERRRRILQHTWRLITVFIILISFRISFPTGNLELRTSVCDSLLWHWDLFQQPATAWVAQGRGGLAVAGVCAWTWCSSTQPRGWVLLCALNTSIPPRASYVQPCSLNFTPSSTASHHSCCGSRFQSFWSGAYSLLDSSSCFSCSFHSFVPADPDMIIMYFHRRQLPLVWVCHLISPFSLSLILWFESEKTKT